MPLLSVQSSCLLCISTLLDSGNAYSRMMELTDTNGKKIFETISICLVCGMPSLLTVHLCSGSPRLHCTDECKRTDHPEKYATDALQVQRVHLSTCALSQMHTQDGGRPSVAVEFEGGDSAGVLPLLL